VPDSLADVPILTILLQLTPRQSFEARCAGGSATHGAAHTILARGDSGLVDAKHGVQPASEDDDTALETSASGRRDILTTSGLMRSPDGQWLSHGTPERALRGERLFMRVTVVGERSAGALLRGLKGLDTVELHGAPCSVDDAFLGREGDEGMTGLGVLLERAAQVNGNPQLGFATPTAFKRHGTWLALPSPENVFGRGPSESPRPTLPARSGDDPTSRAEPTVGPAPGLVGRWIAAGGQDVFAGFSGARVGAAVIRLPGHTVRPKQSMIDAFTGECRFSAGGNIDDSRRLWALCLFAQYVGVGAKTAFGLGQVKVSAH
jgi:hypothetical protein